MTDTKIILYDDTSNQIDYSSAPWYKLNFGSAVTSIYYNGTITGANGPALFSLTFFGSRVSVYGTLRGEGYHLPTSTSSTYSIDNVAKQTFIAPQVIGNSSNRVLFFDSGDIGALNHYMLVNITSATPAFPYYLDYIEVESPSNASSTLLPLSTGSTSRPSPSVIPSATHWSANAKSNVIISVAGALVGVLILLGLLASVFYWRHWRKLRSAKEMDIDDYETIDRLPNAGATNVVPFTLSQESTPPVAGTSSEVGTRGAPRNSESIEPSPNPVSTPTPNNAAHRLPRKKHTTGREEGYSRSATRIDNTCSLPLVPASDEPTAASRTESGSVLDSLADPPPRYTP